MNYPATPAAFLAVPDNPKISDGRKHEPMNDETAPVPAKRMATAYHETVDDLRRELASEAATFREQMKPHQQVVFAAQAEHREVREAERAAYLGCLMAGNYAYTLAAVLGVAGDFGQEVRERLACVADDILTNGDDHDRNADVRPAAGPEAVSA